MLHDPRNLSLTDLSPFVRWSVAGTLCLAGLAIAGLRPPQAPSLQAAEPAAAPAASREFAFQTAGKEKDKSKKDAAKKKDKDKEKDKPATSSKYETFEQAYSVGVGFYNAGKFAEAQEPLEEALKLSDDVKKKVDINRALLSCYRLLPETDKMLTAAEYVITHSESTAEQSLTRTSLMSYIYQRGKTAEAVKRYEDQLKADPNDRTALYVLSEIYARLKTDPKKSAELIERLAALDKKSGKTLNVGQQAQLAGEYVKAKKFKEGAELYETIAPLDEKLAAWHWKEAAAAWLKANDKKKALAAAKKSDAATPESRGDLLEHFWHKALGDIFLETGEPKLAIPHYEQAIARTKIDGYLKSSKEKLAEAQKAAKGK